jgi:hypothetical protein
MEIMNKPRMKLGIVVLTFCGCMAALGQGPTIVATSLSGTNLLLSGSNGQSGGTYYVLTVSKMTAPEVEEVIARLGRANEVLIVADP